MQNQMPNGKGGVYYRMSRSRMFESEQSLEKFMDRD